MSDTTRTEEQLDLALAAELQAALLPDGCPADCLHHVAAARNRMCGSVGGDFYDFIRLNADQFAIIIGDVVGHGIRASLVMAKIMGWMRSDPTGRSRPLHVMKSLNRMLIDLGDRTSAVMPCSMIYVVLDAPTGVAFLVNAGHPRPYLSDSGSSSTVLMGPSNMLLGVQEYEPEEACHTFVAGERLVLYTDGVIDAANDHGQRFGEKRLRQVLADHTAGDPDETADAVFEAVDRFRGDTPQSDDETIVVVDRV